MVDSMFRLVINAEATARPKRLNEIIARNIVRYGCKMLVPFPMNANKSHNTNIPTSAEISTVLIDNIKLFLEARK